MEKTQKYETKKDKGIAGLEILLSVVAMVFIIGFLAMIFGIIGANLSTNTTDATAKSIIGNTTSAIASVPTWFTIIITVGVMVSLILLTVLIIVAIKGTGYLGGGQ